MYKAIKQRAIKRLQLAQQQEETGEDLGAILTGLTRLVSESQHGPEIASLSPHDKKNLLGLLKRKGLLKKQGDNYWLNVTHFPQVFL